MGYARKVSKEDRMPEAKVVPAREALSLISTGDVSLDRAEGELGVGAEGEGVGADAGRETEAEETAADSRQRQ